MFKNVTQRMSTRETATYHLRTMREETGLFQPDGRLPNKISISVDEEHDFHDRPGAVPDVFNL
jgi:hypothetical protein